MILKYGVANFLSFNEYVEFSMLAPGTKVKKRFSDNYASLKGGLDVNKTAVIVGENAGGKSNFVRSMDYLKSFFTTNEHVVSLSGTLHANNFTNRCVKKDNSVQRFFLELTNNEGGIYRYSLVIDGYGINNEELSFRKTKDGIWKKILEVKRKKLKIECDKKSCEKKACRFSEIAEYFIEIDDTDIPEASKNGLSKMANENESIGLYVSKLALLGSKPAAQFVSIILNDVLPDTNTINYDIYKSIKKEQRDSEILQDERFLEIFKMVDYTIIDVEINDEEPFRKTKIIRKGKNGALFSREIIRDSSGVREFFAWAIQIFKVIYENKIIIADEMDRVLNPILSDRIVSLINGKDHLGQFIFTSHNVLHLDLKTYMKEQIYFITKDVETLESDMYSLAEFPEVRYETTKVYEFYLKGILGGTASE